MHLVHLEARFTYLDTDELEVRRICDGAPSLISDFSGGIKRGISVVRNGTEMEPAGIYAIENENLPENSPRGGVWSPLLSFNQRLAELRPGGTYEHPDPIVRESLRPARLAIVYAFS